MNESSHPPGAGSASSSGRKTVTLGDYQLIRRLGQGAMGDVYKAQQLSLGRDVAVKVLYRHKAGSRQTVQRFFREARLLARLNHPNIVHCYGAGKALGRYFLAMEYIDGHTALDWLRRLGKFPLGDALCVGLACARALEHAHESGMVHRDVKPENILIGRNGCIKLGDLGLARSLDDELAVTQTGHGAGTPVYMAPEQARHARHVDHRSDLYALGCTLYHLLTGRLPFPGTTVLEIILAKMKGVYVPARQLDPAIPPRLERILARLLMPAPEKRYPHCSALLADLTALGLAHAQLSFVHTASTSSSGSADPSDCWFIIHRNPDGSWVSRQMTTPEVCTTLATDEEFARTAQASPSAQGEYRALDNYDAFASAYRGRTKRRKAKGDEAEPAVPEVTPASHLWRWLLHLFCRS